MRNLLVCWAAERSKLDRRAGIQHKQRKVARLAGEGSTGSTENRPQGGEDMGHGAAEHKSKLKHSAAEDTKLERLAGKERKRWLTVEHTLGPSAGEKSKQVRLAGEETQLGGGAG